MNKSIFGVALAAAMLIASPAQARGYHHHHHHGGDRAGVFIAGAIIGGIAGTVLSRQPTYVYEPPPERVIIERRYYAPPPRVIYYEEYAQPRYEPAYPRERDRYGY
jgi:hypothetical protein